MEHAFCVKATSKLQRYHADEDFRRGCVHYPAGSVDCFELETVIDLAKAFAIPHDILRRYAMDGVLEILLVLGGNIRPEIERAIRLCKTSTQGMRDKLLAVLEGRFAP